MAELPDELVERVETLVHRVRNAVDPEEADAYREEVGDLLTGHDFTWRIRSEDTREVLVLHPAEWVEDDSIRVERIDDIDRAVETPLDGPGDPDDWDTVEAHNREIARMVEDEHGDVHGANAHAFADFMGNHYARTVESATPDEIEEFLGEYFPRNAWPTDAQKGAVERSIALVFVAAGESVPEF